MIDTRKYREFIEALRDPVFVLNVKGGVESANAAARALFADDPDSGALPAALCDALAEVLHHRSVDTPLQSFDTRLGLRVFELQCGTISGADGPCGAVVVLRDMTDWKAAEEEAQRARMMAGLASEISARFVAVALEDFDDALEVSLREIGHSAEGDAATIFQFSEEDGKVSMTHSWVQPGIPMPDVNLQRLDPAAIPYWSTRIRECDVLAVSSLDELPAEASQERALLETLGIQSIIHVPLTYKSKVIGFMGLACLRSGHVWSPDMVNLLRIAGQVVTNALLQQRFEQTLAQERTLLRTLIDTLPDYIYAKDEASRFILNNRAHVRLLRARHPSDVYGKTDYDIFPRELADRYYEDEQAVIRSGIALVNREESVLTEAGEQQWVLTTKVPLKDAEGHSTGIVGVSRDITSRKRMAEALESHARLIEQANADLSMRNQELDEFTYIASHDLQEPLRKLIAFSDVLQEDLEAGDSDGVRQALRTITSAAKRMRTLVEDLLALSRSGRQSMHMEAMDLSECVAMALDVLEVRIAEEKGEIVQEPLPTVYGDRNLLAQLYQNLIGNALKFHGDAPPWIKLTAERVDGMWVFGVWDNGIGIKPEYTEQIFAPFKRLHGRGRYEGTGIGLAICRKIVERHEGRIWVESIPGEGSHFKFTLQARNEEAAT